MLKISYSSTKNIFQIINNHNKEIIKEFQDLTNNNNDNNSKQNECNCKTQNNCPMNGLCNLNNVVYQGIIYPKCYGLKNLYRNFLHEMEN